MKYRNRFKFRNTILVRHTTWAYNPWLLWLGNRLPWRLKQVVAYHVINEVCLHVPNCIGAFDKLNAQEILSHYKAIHDPALDANCKDFNGGSPTWYSNRPYCKHCGLKFSQHENPKLNALGRLVREEAAPFRTRNANLECSCPEFVPQPEVNYPGLPSCAKCGWGEAAHQSAPDIPEKNPWLQ